MIPDAAIDGMAINQGPTTEPSGFENRAGPDDREMLTVRVDGC